MTNPYQDLSDDDTNKFGQSESMPSYPKVDPVNDLHLSPTANLASPPQQFSSIPPYQNYNPYLPPSPPPYNSPNPPNYYPQGPPCPPYYQPPNQPYYPPNPPYQPPYPQPYGQPPIRPPPQNQFPASAPPPRSQNQYPGAQEPVLPSGAYPGQIVGPKQRTKEDEKTYRDNMQRMTQRAIRSSIMGQIFSFRGF